MSSPFTAYHWGSIPLADIPKDTHSLILCEIPYNSEVIRLLEAVPELTRLTFQTYPRNKIDLEFLTRYASGLKKLPHLNYLDLHRCGLKDKDLCHILSGCSLELCELKLYRNLLKFEDRSPTLPTSSKPRYRRTCSHQIERWMFEIIPLPMVFLKRVPSGSN